MKVLVGVDGSSNSFTAVEFVARLLSPERDQLVLFFASPALTVDEDLDPAVEKRARSVLSGVVLEAALERLPQVWQQRVARKEAVGPPGSALLDAVREEQADLVVVGFRGTSSVWERIILGSVSRAIVYTSPVPVLVVKNPIDAERADREESVTSKPLRALVGYDGAQLAEKISKLLCRFSWPAESAGWVITVVRPMFHTDLPDWVKIERRDPDVAAMAAAWEQEHQQNLQAARSQLEQFRSMLSPCFAKQDVIVVEGRPAEQIVTQLRDKAIDLAVLGSRGRGRVERLLVGSTAEEVLAAASCAVLIVR